METLVSNRSLAFLHGGGEMGELTRKYNWDDTVLGDPQGWPQSLRTTVSNLLRCRFPMFLWWGADLIQFYNDAYRPSLGNDGKHPKALGQRGEECWPEIWPIIFPLISKVLNTGESVWSEDQLVPIFRNGKIEDVYWTFSYSAVTDDEGKPSGVLVTCTETTEKVEYLKKLTESREQLQFAIDATELGTWDLNPLTNKFTGNSRLKEWFGLKPENEIDLQMAIDTIADKDKHQVAEAIQKALEFSSGGHYDIEYGIVHPHTKEQKQVRAMGRAWFNEEKYCYRFNGTLQDITTQHINKKEIEEREKKFRNMVKQAPVGITVFRGPEFMVETANENYLQIVDKKETDFIGKPLFESLPEVKETVSPLLNSVMTTGIPHYGTEFPVTLNRYGRTEITYFNFVYQPLKEDDGTISGVIVIAMDVTLSVKAKHDLSESEKQFRNLIMQSPIPMTIFRGREHIIEAANKVMFEKIWRKKETEIIGKKLLDVFPELKGQKYPALMDEVLSKGIPHRENESLAYVQGEDGMKEFYLDFEYAPLFETDGSISGLIVTVNDVTGKVEARKKIEVAEEQARLAIESGELGTYDINLITDEMLTSQRFQHIWGVTDTTDRSLYASAIHPEDLIKRTEAFKEAYKTGNLDYEARLLLHDDQLRWVKVRGKILYNEENKPSRILGVVQDITDQKLFSEELSKQVKERTIELENKNRELERSNTNLEEFAYAASHDMKEPIRKIHFFSNRLRDSLKTKFSPDELKFFDKMELAAKRMGSLIDDLLSYSQVSMQPMMFEEVDLNKIMAAVIHDLELQIEEKKAVLHFNSLPIISGHPGQIQQAFQNLISNALKFSKTEEAPSILIERQMIGAHELPFHVTAEKQKKFYHLITVKDNGIGFDQNDGEKIFNVFTRLHGNMEYRGTGVGLSIVRKVAENHNGFVNAESEFGKGACFNIYLPSSG